MNTDKKKILDTGWKKRTRIVNGLERVDIRRRVVCEGIGVAVGTPDRVKREDVKFEMTVWGASPGRWSWLACRTDGLGARASSKHGCASKAIAKHEAMLAGHELAKALARQHDLPADRVVWPPWPDPKPSQRMQWPPNNAPLGWETHLLVRFIAEAVEQTHEVRRTEGATSNYMGIDSVHVSANDHVYAMNVVDNIAQEERDAPKRGMLDEWILLAFVLGIEQGTRLAQEEHALWAAARANPEVMDMFRRKFEREQIPESVPVELSPAFERTVALYRTKLAARLVLAKADDENVEHARVAARIAYTQRTNDWEATESDLIAATTPTVEPEATPS